MPKISIILPSYNRATYLAQTIDSCLAQTLKDFELIIVDDCSVDASIEVAEFYSQQDSRIKVIANKTNQKLPSTLNIGFEKAKGQYFTWISDDNLCTKCVKRNVLSIRYDAQHRASLCRLYVNR